MSMKLTNPTDEQLNAAFAEQVCGWKWRTFPDGACPEIKHWRDVYGNIVSIHWPKYSFTTSADAVLPWLEKRQWVRVELCAFGEPKWGISVMHGPIGMADTFPRAATIALLRAHGVEVEFS